MRGPRPTPCIFPEYFLQEARKTVRRRTASELASLHGVHPTMIHTWKKHLLGNAEDIFQSGAKASSAEHEALQAQLYEQIGRLKTELDWLKKKAASFG